MRTIEVAPPSEVTMDVWGPARDDVKLLVLEMVGTRLPVEVGAELRFRVVKVVRELVEQ